jgi:ankyrin repeat protein
MPRAAGWILSRPASIPAAGCGPTPGSRAPYPGQTGLHLAILHLQLEVVRLLLERGADPSVRDELLHNDGYGMVRLLFATGEHDPVIRQLRELMKSPSR